MDTQRNHAMTIQAMLRRLRLDPETVPGAEIFLAALALFLLIGLGGCGPARTLESYPCPDGGTSLTYSNFGKNFLDRYCQTCHASDAPDRKGAPSAYSFGDPESVQRHRVRIFERSAAENDTMPPGPDDPPLALRLELAEWLACGAR
jgi:hypothetical protein